MIDIKEFVLAEEPITKNELALLKVVNMVNAERIIVTGSTALYKMGLTQDVGDLDIILVSPDKVTKDILLFWQKQFPALTKAPENSQLFSIFTLHKTKVDVFIQRDFSERTIPTNKGYEIATVKWIVTAKMTYKRLKDWLQLRQIALDIFDETKFQRWLKETPMKQIIQSKDEY
jgi:hypothetical protein